MLHLTDAPATPTGAQTLRIAFAQWLHTHFALDADQSADLVLATNEALANAVEHAYRGNAEPGTIDLHVTHDPTTVTVLACVVDRGRWRAPTPDPLHLRGRGLPLMRALCTHADIDATDAGTTVSLSWAGIARPRKSGSCLRRLRRQFRSDRTPGLSRPFDSLATRPSRSHRC